MKHILHIITNAVEPTLQSVLRTHSERDDLRITIVTTQHSAQTPIANHASIHQLADAGEPTFERSTSGHSTSADVFRVIDYDKFMDLIFEAESIVAW